MPPSLGRLGLHKNRLFCTGGRTAWITRRKMKMKRYFYFRLKTHKTAIMLTVQLTERKKMKRVQLQVKSQATRRVC